MAFNVKLFDNSDEVRSVFDEAIERALEEVGLAAEGYAKLACPVDTGRLRNSISHTQDDRAAYIGTNVEYGPYVEFGTSRQRAKPYIKPAVVDHVDEYKKIVERNLKG